MHACMHSKHTHTCIHVEDEKSNKVGKTKEKKMMKRREEGHDEDLEWLKKMMRMMKKKKRGVRRNRM